MSILIKGMEMPTSCHECEFVDILPTCPCRKMADEDFWNNVSLAVEGHKDCPLVPVPEHGRLIEEKAIKNKIANHILDTEYAWGWNAAMKQCYEAVEDAPTIIPADPAEEGE